MFVKILTLFANSLSKFAGECPEPGCKARVTVIAEDVQQIQADLRNEVFPCMRKTAISISKVEGYLEALKDGQIIVAKCSMQGEDTERNP